MQLIWINVLISKQSSCCIYFYYTCILCHSILVVLLLLYSLQLSVVLFVHTYTFTVQKEGILIGM